MEESARVPGEQEGLRRLRRRLLAFVVTWGVLLSVNNLLPYAGIRDDSCQTMFSELEWWQDGNNHLFMPQVTMSDAWDHYYDVSAEVTPEPSAGALPWEEEELVRWLNQDERQLNREALRVVVDRLCGRGHALALRWRERPSSPRRATDDACAEPTLRDWNGWIPIRRYETDLPEQPYPGEGQE